MQPYLALITPLTGMPDQGLPPVSPGSPSHPWVPPGGGQPGSPSYPIYHPGHPDHGLPAYPDQGLPGAGGQPSHPWVPPPGSSGGGQPSHPIHIPGVPDQGLPPGELVPPEAVQLPELPDEYADDLVIAVKAPGQEWRVTSYDVQPDQGQPAPTPHRR